jgi:peptidoglycan/LPS O-acetylase OafA/YrhL
MLSRIELFCAGWLMLVLALRFVADYRGGQLPFPLGLLLIADYAQLFVAGVITYQIFKRGLSIFRVTVLIGAILTQCYIQGAMAGVIAAISIAAVYAASRGWLQLLEITPLIFLGNISYSLYLIHQNIGYVVIRAGYAYGFNNKLAIAIAAAFAILLASAMTFIVERPAMMAIRSWYRRLTGTAEIPASPTTSESRTA